MTILKKYELVKKIVDVLCEEDPGRVLTARIEYKNFSVQESLYIYASTTDMYNYTIVQDVTTLTELLSKLDLYSPLPKETDTKTNVENRKEEQEL